MKIIDNIFKRLERWIIKRSTTSNPSQWFVDWVNGGAATSSGVSVNCNTALKFTPFWASVRIISGTIGALPFIVYKRVKEGKERVVSHRVYQLLHNRPNQYMDALTFIETRMAHALCYGNGYAEIERDGGGRPIALWPLLPDKTERKITDEGVPYYEVRQSKGPTVYLPDYNVLHIKGLGFDGYTGYNVVQYHKEAIGYGVAAKSYGSKFFGNDGSPGGILEHPHTLTDAAVKHLKETWGEGLSDSHRMKVLEEGMKWHQTGVDPQKAQALETQKYNVDDCSRIFQIPPHKLGSLDKATFSNIEEQNLEFYTATMLYWFRKWEQECNYKLFTPSEQKTMFCEILVDGLLRGNIKSRYEAYNVGRNAGFLSVNEIRLFENMNNIGKAGDIYLEPLNMKEAGTDPDEPAEPDESVVDEEDDDVRKAHRDLIISQWGRLIRELNKGLELGVRSDFYENLRRRAKLILFESVNAYGSLHGVSSRMTDKLLHDAVDKYVIKGNKINAVDMADMIMNLIGDKNDVSKTNDN